MRILASLALLSFATSDATAQSVLRHSAPEVGRMVWDPLRERMVLFSTEEQADGVCRVFELGPRGWVRCDPATGSPEPLVRFKFDVAWDSINGEILMFGGEARPLWNWVPLDETWSWNGRRWRQLSPANSPSARRSHRMTWDSHRQRIVLFGGLAPLTVNDTWEWDGVNWTQRTPATQPPSRRDHAQCYDPIRQRTVMVGGSSLTGSTVWEWDGLDWTAISPAMPSSTTSSHQLAFDARLSKVVLQGNTDSIWSWDGQNWAPERNGGSRGGSRLVRDLAYDPSQQLIMSLTDYGRSGIGLGYGSAITSESVVTQGWNGSIWNVLDGGAHASFIHPIAFDEARAELVGIAATTVSFDGRRWHPRSNLNAPLPNRFTTMAYDPVNQRIVAFGGLGIGGSTAEMWEWDGSMWSQRTGIMTPPARRNASMTLDRARNRLVLFGGLGANGLLGDTWEWDGTRWTQSMTAGGPSARSHSLMGFDPRRNAIIVLGGRQGNQGLNDVWSYDGVAWTRLRDAPRVGQRTLIQDPNGQRLLMAIHGRALYALSRPPNSGWAQLSSPAAPPLYTHQTTTDPLRGVIVSVSNRDTWVSGATTDATVVHSGAPCPAADTPTLTTFGQAWRARSDFAFDVRLTSTANVAAVLIGDTPASIALPFAGGCTLGIGSLIAPMALSPNQSGFASASLPISATTTLLGTTIHSQVVELEFGASSVLRLSNTLAWSIGD